jgi:hypothetical protein
MKYLVICILSALSINSTCSQSINRYDIIIDEIMIDPSPSIGLPSSEFIELKNISNIPLNLSGLQLADGSSAASININYLLQPDSFVIICSNSSVAQFSLLGPTISVSNFPSLDNDAELLYLRSKENKTIHAISYNKRWYKNSFKAEGGWTLEMIDTRNPCNADVNWSASINEKGGTPGRVNSVDASLRDNVPPAIINGYAPDSLHIVLIFSESLDSTDASFSTRYIVEEGRIAIAGANPIPPLFDRIMLQLSNPLQKNKVYSVAVQSIKDCAGNEINKNRIIDVGWASSANENDIIINEILFNPKPSGVDYIELYNRSEKNYR